MSRNPKHPWAPFKRDGKCLAFELGPEERKLWLQSAKPFSGCYCLWCIQAATPEQPQTLWPACRCETCESHILWRQPEHFMRQCKHGRRWTIDQSESDECDTCNLEAMEYNVEVMKQQLAQAMS